MASFSTLSKTYANVQKLSKYATTVLLMCCYLYRKRSNVNNVNAEAKEQGRDMQTPIDDSDIFTEVSRNAQASPSSSLEPHARNPSQGPSSRSGNSVDSVGPSPHASGSPTCLSASLSRMLPAVFTIKLSAKTPRALFPLVHGGVHTTTTVGVISQDYKLIRCTTMMCASTE